MAAENLLAAAKRAPASESPPLWHAKLGGVGGIVDPEQAVASFCQVWAGVSTEVKASSQHVVLLACFLSESVDMD